MKRVLCWVFGHRPHDQNVLLRSNYVRCQRCGALVPATYPASKR